ncbi:hypothetical protein DV735_g2259, partial [Chaetothyriales sp. CBS 134920]
MPAESQISPPSKEAVKSAEKLYNDIRVAFPKAVSEFESKWTAWETVLQPQTTHTTQTISPSTVAGTDEFKALERLGPKIIPFIVFKLATNTGQDFSGVFLC